LHTPERVLQRLEPRGGQHNSRHPPYYMAQPL
jgi:hypothetical protein